MDETTTTPSPKIENTALDTSLFDGGKISKVEEEPTVEATETETTETVETEPDTTEEVTAETKEETSTEEAESEATEEETTEVVETEEVVTEDEDEDTEEEEAAKIREEIQNLKDRLNKNPEALLLEIKKVHGANESYREEILEIKQDLKDKEKELKIVNNRLAKREAENFDTIYDDFDRPTVELAKSYRPLLKMLKKFDESGSPEDYKQMKLYFDDVAESKGLLSQEKYPGKTAPAAKPTQVSNLFG